MTRSQLLAALTDARTAGDLELADAIEAVVDQPVCGFGIGGGQCSSCIRLYPEWLLAERMIAERGKA